MITAKAILVTAAGLALAVQFGATDEPNSWDDEAVIAQVIKYQTMKRVTKQRFLMHSEAAQMCRAAFQPITHSPHQERFCHVFVSKTAEKAMLSGEGTYPVGAMLVKAKYPDEKKPDIELFTVMIKREPGYHQGHGDWEYVTIDGRCETVFARGRLESCIGCHDQYESTDFVTRMYMPRKKK